MCKPRRKKQVFDDDDVLDIMVDKVGDLSNTIRKTNFHWTDKLSRCFYAHLDYDDTVFDRLFESEMKAWFFISKPNAAQKWYLDQVARVEFQWAELTTMGPIIKLIG